jgi:lipid-binding SYLF domain-containing protein
MKPGYLLQLHRGMMRMFLSSLLLVLILSVPQVGITAEENEYAKTIKLFNTDDTVQSIYKNAYGYAVFPTIGKGGLVVGGSYGKGKVYRKGKVTGTASMTEFSLGVQVGGAAFSEIIFFENQKAYDEFTKGDFAFDAEASTIAIGAGAHVKTGSQGASAGASAGQDVVQTQAKFRNGMAVFVRQKGGLMVDASIGGQKFKFTPTKKQQKKEAGANTAK